MERWNWFVSGNISGKWIVTSGYAEVTNTPEKLLAVLRYSPDTDPHAHIEGNYFEDGSISAVVKSNDPEVPSYEVEGTLIEGESIEGIVTSIILTDGFTVVGLAHGPRSEQDNLA